MNKLICGVGLSDSKASKNGKVLKSYKLWGNTLTRCYCDKYQERQPTYKSCSVAEVWHKYSNFKKWFSLHYRENYQLDKDLLKPDNKIYSPLSCVYIPQEINKLLISNSVCRGEHPQGVDLYKRGKYRASIRIKSLRFIQYGRASQYSI
jgi:hypothetical protein